MKIQDSLGFLLNVNARLISRKLNNKIKKYDITTSQWSLLKLLSIENNLTQVEISNKLNSDMATVGSVVDRLVKKKLLSKKHLKNDRRAYIVSILDEGRNIANMIEKDVMECNHDAVCGLSTEETQSLISLLKKITPNLL